MLQISNGDWLLVKRRLNAGEQREMFSQWYLRAPDGSLVTDADGKYQVDPQRTGPTKVAAYLLDWSLKDAQGKPVAPGRHALDALDPDDYKEIEQAIDAHEAAMDAERAAQKKILAGETASLPTSPLPVGVG